MMYANVSIQSNMSKSRHSKEVATFTTVDTWQVASHLESTYPMFMNSTLNPKKTGLFWRLVRLGGGGGGGGGGGMMAPPWDLGRGSRDRRENLHNGSVRCNRSTKQYI